MQVQVLKNSKDMSGPPRIDSVHTIEELDELVDELGGSIQLRKTEKGWLIDNFKGK